MTDSALVDWADLAAFAAYCRGSGIQPRNFMEKYYACIVRASADAIRSAHKEGRLESVRDNLQRKLRERLIEREVRKEVEERLAKAEEEQGECSSCGYSPCMCDQQ